MDKKNRGYSEEEYREEVYFAEDAPEDGDRPVTGPLRIAGRIALVLHIVAAMLIIFFAATIPSGKGNRQQDRRHCDQPGIHGCYGDRYLLSGPDHEHLEYDHQ